MPVRNVVRIQSPHTFYHVYNRGHNKELLFIDDADYAFFTFLLARCYGPKQLKSSSGRVYPWFGDRVSLHSFCLMPNHFHLLLFQNDDASSLSKSMQSLCTTYSMYFNKKYGRRGSIFESVFKASPIYGDKYLLHISRYIHLNHKDYRNWKYSSYSDYIGEIQHEWVRRESIASLFNTTEEYIDFVDDYKDYKNEIDNLKYELADYGETY